MRRFFSTLLLTMATLCAHAGETLVVLRPLPAATVSQMNNQRAFVAALVKKHLPGARLSKTREDFAVLQALVDKRVFNPNQTWELQALGVCFGDALAEYLPGLAWVEVTDSYGTDPTLQFKKTYGQVNALTMISKRVEDGREVNLQEIAAGVAQYIRDHAHEFKVV